MVGKKHKSKRTTLKQKYKVERKVKEHHRKVRKLAKKSKKAGMPSVKEQQLKKDPGVPNLHPYKLHMMRQMEDQANRREEQQKRNKMERAKLRQKRRKERALAAQDEHSKLERMMREAARRNRDFSRDHGDIDFEHGGESSSSSAAASQGYFRKRDGSQRAYQKEVMHVIEQSDVILEVLDARDPMGCRCKGVERLVKASGRDKTLILLLNKVDLVPREVVAEWLTFLRQEHSTYAFKSSTQTQRRNLGRSSQDITTASQGALQTSECLGAGQLMTELKRLCLTGGDAKTKASITVGLIGYPNVGKSSVINSLKRQRAATVGGTPGVTKEHKEIKLDSNIKLLDAPGIVFSRGNMIDSDVILRNAVKIEQLGDEATDAVQAILDRCNKQHLQDLYKVGDFENVQEFLYEFAHVRKMLGHEGVPKYIEAAKSVLQDWTKGKIPFFTQPPRRNRNVTASRLVGQDEDEQDEDILDKLTSLRSYTDGFVSMQPGDTVDNELDVDSESSDDEEGNDGEWDVSDLHSDDDDFDDDEEEYEDDDEDDDDDDDGLDEEDMDDQAGSSKRRSISSALQARREAKEAQEMADRKGKGKVRAPVQDMDEFQDRYNPQTNKNLRKAAKEAKKMNKKQQRKQREKLVQAAYGKLDDEDFDFTSDFVADNDREGASSDDENDDEDDERQWPDPVDELLESDDEFSD